VTAARETVRRLSISVSPTHLSVTPGGRESILVTVGNLGTTVEGADLRLTGLPSGWWSFEPARVSLLPSTETKATLTVHPPRASESKAGEYPIAVDVSAQLDRRASTEASVVVRSFVELASEVRPENSTGYTSGRHEVRIENASNVRVTARVEASDRDDVLQFSPLTADVAVEPGGTATTAVKVRARKLRWLGRTPARRFNVRVGAPGATPTDRQASFTQTPLLPRWAPPVAAIAAAAIVGGILLVGRGSGSTNLRVQHANAASQSTDPRTAPAPTTSTVPHTATTVAASTARSGPTADPRSQPPAASPLVPTGAGTTSHAPPPPAPTATTTTTPQPTVLHGIVRWPDKTAAAGVPFVVYPQGVPSPPAQSSLPTPSTPSTPSTQPGRPGGPSASVMTGPEGTYATPICTQHRCRNLQAFLSIAASGDFPDGCVLPLTTASGPASGFPSLGGVVDWTVTDGTCSADAAGTPIEDPNVPAFTAEYVEQKINARLATTTGSTSTTTTP